MEARAEVLALWVDLDAAGPTFERESAWTEWVRRVSATELARRMGGRVAGTEVRDVAVHAAQRGGTGDRDARHDRRGGDHAPSGSICGRPSDFRRCSSRSQRVRGPQGETEFVFLGRGWGHGVGLCQNGAFGMALCGLHRTTRSCRHYYTGIEIAHGLGV